MTASDIVVNLQKFGQENANPILVEKYKKYFKEGYDAFGLNHEQVKSRVTEILRDSGITQELVLETSLLLVQSPKYEMTVIAIQLVLGFQKSWTVETFNTVERWFSLGITNWAQTDETFN